MFGRVCDRNHLALRIYWAHDGNLVLYAVLMYITSTKIQYIQN